MITEIEIIYKKKHNDSLDTNNISSLILIQIVKLTEKDDGRRYREDTD